MPKVDSSRNYYADLEVSPTASVDEIKKQFRKLALKYHPDRNPGREEEVNSKFQVIQSAHEVLTDASLKAKYDEQRNRTSSRYPGASGVRGNPWADAGKAYPPPPRRNNNPPNFQSRTASGAARYGAFTKNYQGNKPPPPKRNPTEARDTYQAWESMRPESRGKGPPPTPGRAPTSAARENHRTSDSEAHTMPRTASQRQKAQAAFGNNRRTGFAPRSPTGEWEAPVTSKNYATNKFHTNIFSEEPSSAGPRRPRRASAAVPDSGDQFNENFADMRQSTPYATPGGEKTNLFDEAAGAKLQENQSPQDSIPPSFRRQRSSSTPRSSSNDGGSEDSAKGVAGNRRSVYSSNGFSSRASDRYKPKPNTNGTERSAAGTGAVPVASSGKPDAATSHNTGQGHNPPPVYASPVKPSDFPPQHPFSRPLYADRAECSLRGSATRSYGAECVPYLHRLQQSTDTSSGDVKSGDCGLNSFESRLKHDVDQLLNRRVRLGNGLESVLEEAESNISPSVPDKTAMNADSIIPISFTFSADPNAPNAAPIPNRFARSSADNINTRFVQDEGDENWQFQAGSASANEGPAAPRPRNIRSKSSSPTKDRQVPTFNISVPDDSGADGSRTGFEEQWGAKIGSEHFVPQPNSGTGSPTRRGTGRRLKPVKLTKGSNAGLVDDESSEGNEWNEIPRADSGPASPNAMDIDTPPPEKTEETPKAAEKQAARNIPVEPTRPEWRAGKLDGSQPQTAAGGAQSNSTSNAPNPFAPSKGGSEDTDEFRASFADFKNVEPLADAPATGLKSFADMKATLPFESKPSEQIFLDGEPQQGSTAIPSPPVAPRLPPTMAIAGIRPNNGTWRKYAQDFYSYMDKWEIFNTKIMNYLTTRQQGYRSHRQALGVSWLDSAEGADGAQAYLAELDHDNEVRKKWGTACDEHQLRIREFMAFRDRVK